MNWAKSHADVAITSLLLDQLLPSLALPKGSRFFQGSINNVLFVLAYYRITFESDTYLQPTIQVPGMGYFLFSLDKCGLSGKRQVISGRVTFSQVASKEACRLDGTNPLLTHLQSPETLFVSHLTSTDRNA